MIKGGQMDRRDFFKKLAAWSAGTIAAAPVFTITPELFAAQPQKPDLTVATGTDVETMVRNLLKPLGGIRAFVKPDSRVVVKPNIGWDRSPEQAANTHPELVRAVVKLALEAGAKQVMVFDRTCNEERRCYHNSGIKPLLEELDDPRVDCDYIDDRKFIPVDIRKGKSLTQWSFYKEALEADCYINLPIAKHHSLARLTIGMKNIMGVIGGRRGNIHRNMGQNLADLNSVLYPHLTIVDATRILLRNGPQGGRLSDVKKLDTLVASRDIVAADAYATTLFGMRPEEIPSTRAGHAMGLGQMDLNQINIIRV